MNTVLIENWLNYCETEKIEPWRYDFKTENLVKGVQNPNPILRIFEWYINYDEKYQEGEIENTELAKEIYCNLWNIDEKIIFLDRPFVDIDVMNSFWTIYQRAIKIDKNQDFYKWKNKKINEETFQFLMNNYDKYSEINKNFEEYSSLTHTIGNFILEPRGFNMGRQNSDYWDLGMILLQSFFNCLDGEDNWKNFVEKYFLQPYVNNSQEYVVTEFWDRKNNYVNPLNNQDVKSFIAKANWCIEERGKLMIKKLCEDSNLTHYKFYDLHLKNLKVKFSDDQ